jgi:hypothetical protein
MGENFDRRIKKDRRRKSTPALTRYTFLGRRRMIQREVEKQRGGYVDRYSPTLFFFLISIVGLNVLDAIFTIMILDLKGWEANPVVRSVIDLYGTEFWIWKFFIVSFSLALLCLHSKFKLVREMIITISCLYTLVVAYQVFILLHL